MINILEIIEEILIQNTTVPNYDVNLRGVDSKSAYLIGLWEGNIKGKDQLAREILKIINKHKNFELCQ